VSFDLTGPAAFGCVGDELFFGVQPFLQPGDVLRCGDELGAAQVDVALARTLLGQAQAVAELEFGLVEVGLQPVEGGLVKFTAAS
jgi:hypothetical protein